MHFAVLYTPKSWQIQTDEKICLIPALTISNLKYNVELNFKTSGEAAVLQAGLGPDESVELLKACSERFGNACFLLWLRQY